MGAVTQKLYTGEADFEIKSVGRGVRGVLGGNRSGSILDFIWVWSRRMY